LIYDRSPGRLGRGDVYVFGDPLSKSDLTGQKGCTVAIDKSKNHGGPYWGAFGGAAAGGTWTGVFLGVHKFMTGGGSKVVRAGWGFGIGAAIGDATVSYISTGKVNWCTAAIRGGVAVGIGPLF
jgi:hypothetical protein